MGEKTQTKYHKRFSCPKTVGEFGKRQEEKKSSLAGGGREVKTSSFIGNGLKKKGRDTKERIGGLHIKLQSKFKRLGEQTGSRNHSSRVEI